MKENVFEDFEDYLQDKLNEEDRAEFEKKLVEDNTFAESFEIYKDIEISMHSRSANESEERALVSTLSDLGKQYITETTGEGSKPQKTFLKPAFRWISGIAAGFALYFVVSTIFFKNSPDAQELANEYFATNYMILGQTMGNTADSLQLGILAYNTQDYELALDIFENVLLRDSLNSEVEKSLGLTHLAMGDFEGALRYFENLSARKDLHINQGKFLQAMALLKRGNAEDLKLAEKLLKEVVNLQLAGYLEAKRWLDSL